MEESDPPSVTTTPVDARRLVVDSDGYHTDPMVPNLQHQPVSPPMMMEDDRYGDYVLSDEEMGQLWIDDDEEEEDQQPRDQTRVIPDDDQEDDDEEEDDDADDEEEGPRTDRRRKKSRWRRTKRRASRVQQQEEDDDEGEDADDELGELKRLAHGKQAEDAMMVDDKPWRSSTRHRRNSSGPIFRYIRSLTAGKRTPKEGDEEGAESLEDEDEDDDDDVVTSSGSSIGDESDSWDEDMVESDEEPIGTVDWGGLSVVPNTFLRTHRSSSHPNLMVMTPHQTTQSSPYLDSSMWQTAMTQSTGDSFVSEHALLLQAVLQLLAEREQVGVEGSVDASDNIWKKGPLKKMSFAVGRRKMRPTAGAWVVKYVELRRGNLTYYEDSGDHGRKTIHLRQTEAVVQESTQRGPGFVFEMLIQGSPARYWTARSEEERQAWIRAIQSAMLGDKQVPRDIDLAPYQEALNIYKELKEAVNNADMQELYMEAIQNAAAGTASIQIPVQWLRDEVGSIVIDNNTKKNLIKQQRKTSAHQRLKASIADFWKSMRQLSFSVNGYVILRNTPVAAERVVGSLTRCILEFDKAAESEQANAITELQAVSYARSILLSLLQGNEQADTETVVQDLLQGRPELVHVTSMFEEDDLDSLARLQVSFAGERFSDDFDEPGAEDMSNWIMLARRKSSNSSVPGSRWKRRYAVLSGAVLSFYEAASPRPHGLRLQLVLSSQTSVDTTEMPKDLSKSDSSILNDRRYVVIIKTQGSERLLSFEEEPDMVAWKEALQKTIELTSEAETIQRTDARAPSTPAKMLVKGAERVIKTAADGSIRGGIRVIKGAKDSGMKAMKIATDSGMKAMKIATDGSMKVFRGTVGRLRQSSGTRSQGGGCAVDRPGMNRVPSVQLLLNKSNGKQPPTVQCVVQRGRTFSIRAARADSSAESDDDHWMSVQVTWYQAFLMSGGPSGRINSGDALVEVAFVGKDDDDDDEEEEWVGELEEL